MASKKPRLISPRVTGMQCECTWNGSEQGDFRRYDFCKCKVSGTKGKRGLVVDLPGEYPVGVMFIKGGK